MGEVSGHHRQFRCIGAQKHLCTQYPDTPPSDTPTLTLLAGAAKECVELHRAHMSSADCSAAQLGIKDDV